MVSLTGFGTVVSPLINYGLGHIRSSISPWRTMYLFAGGTIDLARMNLRTVD